MKRKIDIIVDTREKAEFNFESQKDANNEIIIHKDNLKCGDYSLVGHDMARDDDSIVIERKSCCLELCGNLGLNWERFQNELALMKSFKHKCIVVSGNYNFEQLYHNKKTELHPKFISKRLAEIYLNYQVPVYFLGNRINCETFIVRLFKRIIEKTNEIGAVMLFDTV